MAFTQRGNLTICGAGGLPPKSKHRKLIWQQWSRDARNGNLAARTILSLMIPICTPLLLATIFSRLKVNKCNQLISAFGCASLESESSLPTNDDNCLSDRCKGRQNSIQPTFYWLICILRSAICGTVNKVNTWAAAQKIESLKWLYFKCRVIKMAPIWPINKFCDFQFLEKCCHVTPN